MSHLLLLQGRGRWLLLLFSLNLCACTYAQEAAKNGQFTGIDNARRRSLFRKDAVAMQPEAITLMSEITPPKDMQSSGSKVIEYFRTQIRDIVASEEPTEKKIAQPRMTTLFPRPMNVFRNPARLGNRNRARQRHALLHQNGRTHALPVSPSLFSPASGFQAVRRKDFRNKMPLTIKMEDIPRAGNILPKANGEKRTNPFSMTGSPISSSITPYNNLLLGQTSTWPLKYTNTMSSSNYGQNNNPFHPLGSSLFGSSYPNGDATERQFIGGVNSHQLPFSGFSQTGSLPGFSTPGALSAAFPTASFSGLSTSGAIPSLPGVGPFSSLSSTGALSGMPTSETFSQFSHYNTMPSDGPLSNLLKQGYMVDSSPKESSSVLSSLGQFSGLSNFNSFKDTSPYESLSDSFKNHPLMSHDISTLNSPLSTLQTGNYPKFESSMFVTPKPVSSSFNINDYLYNMERKASKEREGEVPTIINHIHIISPKNNKHTFEDDHIVRVNGHMPSNVYHADRNSAYNSIEDYTNDRFQRSNTNYYPSIAHENKGNNHDLNLTFVLGDDIKMLKSESNNIANNRDEGFFSSLRRLFGQHEDDTSRSEVTNPITNQKQHRFEKIIRTLDNEAFDAFISAVKFNSIVDEWMRRRNMARKDHAVNRRSENVSPEDEQDIIIDELVDDFISTLFHEYPELATQMIENKPFLSLPKNEKGILEDYDDSYVYSGLKYFVDSINGFSDQYSGTVREWVDNFGRLLTERFFNSIDVSNDIREDLNRIVHEAQLSENNIDRSDHLYGGNNHNFANYGNAGKGHNNFGYKNNGESKGLSFSAGYSGNIGDLFRGNLLNQVTNSIGFGGGTKSNFESGSYGHAGDHYPKVSNPLKLIKNMVKTKLAGFVDAHGQFFSYLGQKAYERAQKLRGGMYNHNIGHHASSHGNHRPGKELYGQNGINKGFGASGGYGNQNYGKSGGGHGVGGRFRGNQFGGFGTSSNVANALRQKLNKGHNVNLKFNYGSGNNDDRLSFRGSYGGKNNFRGYDARNHNGGHGLRNSSISSYNDGGYGGGSSGSTYNNGQIGGYNHGSVRGNGQGGYNAHNSGGRYNSNNKLASGGYNSGSGHNKGNYGGGHLNGNSGGGHHTQQNSGGNLRYRSNRFNNGRKHNTNLGYNGKHGSTDYDDYYEDSFADVAEVEVIGEVHLKDNQLGIVTSNIELHKGNSHLNTNTGFYNSNNKHGHSQGKKVKGERYNKREANINSKHSGDFYDYVYENIDGNYRGDSKEQYRYKNFRGSTFNRGRDESKPLAAKDIQINQSSKLLYDDGKVIINLEYPLTDNTDTHKNHDWPYSEAGNTRPHLKKTPASKPSSVELNSLGLSYHDIRQLLEEEDSVNKSHESIYDEIDKLRKSHNKKPLLGARYARDSHKTKSGSEDNTNTHKLTHSINSEDKEKHLSQIEEVYPRKVPIRYHRVVGSGRGSKFRNQDSTDGFNYRLHNPLVRFDIDPLNSRRFRESAPQRSSDNISDDLIRKHRRREYLKRRRENAKG